MSRRRDRPPRPSGSLRASFAAVIAILAMTAAPAHAQNAEEPPQDVPIISLPALINKGEVAELVLDTTEATEEILVAIHEVLTRDQYLAGELAPIAVADTFSLPVDSNELTLTIAPSRSTDLDDDIDLVSNLEPGLHQLTVVVDGQIVDQGHMLVRPDVVESSVPLAVSIALFVDTDPVLLADGSRQISSEDREKLETLALAFELVPEAPLTVQLQPDIIDALQRSEAPEDVALLGRLRAALQGRSVLSAPLVDIDDQAFAEANIGLFAGALTTRGDAILAEELAVSPNRTVARLDASASGAAIDLLRDLGAGHVVVDEQRFPPLDPDAFPGTLAERFRMSGAGIGTIDAAQTDQRLAERLLDWLGRDALFQELGIVAMERPEIPRGVILPIDWFAAIDVVELATTLSGIEFHPDLELVDLPTYFASVSEARDGVEPLLREHRSEAASALDDYPERLGETSRLVDSYESLLGLGHSTVEPLRALLDASADRTFDPSERNRYLTNVAGVVDAQLGAVVIPDDLSFSLTSRDATIPLVIENLGTEQLNVVLHFESDNRIELPDGASVPLVLEPGRNTLDVPIHARSSGTSVIDMTVSSPDGLIELSAGSVRVNSTALSGVGVIIAVVALAVLLIWWLRQILQTRKAKAATRTARVDAEDTSTVTSG